MRKINYKAVAAVTLAAFAFSSLYYSPLLLGNVWNELRRIHPGAAAGTPIWKPIIELVRTLIVAYVFARFIALLGISDWKSAIYFGLGIWVFPVIVSKPAAKQFLRVPRAYSSEHVQ